MLEVLVLKLVILAVSTLRCGLILLARVLDLLLLSWFCRSNLVWGVGVLLQIYKSLLFSLLLLQEVNHVVHVMIHYKVCLVVSCLRSALRSYHSIVLVQLKIDQLWNMVKVYHALVETNATFRLSHEPQLVSDLVQRYLLRQTHVHIEKPLAHFAIFSLFHL